MKWMAMIAMCILVGGCAPVNMVVLMPDADGRVGQAEVATEGGKQTLTEARSATTYADAKAAPTPPRVLTDEEITKEFRTVLESEPDRPEAFVLYFLEASVTLAPESEAMIPDIISKISGRKSRDVSIVGHSDRQGSDALNMELSLQRARHIQDVLAAAGVDAAILQISSHGEGNPIITTADDVAEPRNRRVEVTVR